MQPRFSSLSYDFLFPKLHGMWARSIVGTTLLKLIHDGRQDAVARVLAPLGINVGNRSEVQKKLTLYLIKELGAIMHLLDKRTGSFYAQLIERFFFENLKIVLRYHYFPKTDVNIEFLLIDSPVLPQPDVSALLEAKNLNQFFQHLPAHDCNKELLPILVELDDTKDFFVAESKIDQLYYQSLYAAAKRLPLSTRRIAKELLRTEIDIINLIMIARNAQLYHLPQDKLLSLCIPDGFLLGKGGLQQLAEASQEKLALEAVPPEYAKTLRPLAQSELYVSENALWNLLYRKAYKAFMDYGSPDRAIVAFPFLKRSEVLNLGRVYEGIHLGLSTETVTSMMIGVNDV